MNPLPLDKCFRLILVQSAPEGSSGTSLVLEFLQFFCDRLVRESKNSGNYYRVVTHTHACELKGKTRPELVGDERTILTAVMTVITCVNLTLLYMVFATRNINNIPLMVLRLIDGHKWKIKR